MYCGYGAATTRRRFGAGNAKYNYGQLTLEKPGVVNQGEAKCRDAQEATRKQCSRDM